MLALKGKRQELHDVLNEIAAYYQKLGVNVRAFDENDRLEDVCEEVLSQALDEMHLFVGTLREVPSSSYNEKALLQKHLKRLGIRSIDESIYDYLEDGHLLEIYNRQFLQRYRSKRFFELCSYSLAKLLTSPAYKIYYRDPEVVRDGMHLMLDVFEHPEKGVRDVSHLDTHLWETELDNYKAFRVMQKVAVPLVNGDDECTHVLSIAKAYHDTGMNIVPLALKNRNINECVSLVEPGVLEKFES